MPVPENGISPNLSDWIENRAREATGKKIRTQNLHALRQLSQPERIFGELTLVRHAQKGVSAVLSGRRKKSLGVAVDIGTTTVGVYLCDFHSGEILAADASANPQRRFGADVISRIAMANENSSGLETLKNLITHKINHLIGNCLEYAGATREDIDEVVIVGNSVMEQIFAGFHPHSLGVSPYLPTARTFPDFYAGDLGLEISPGTNVHLFPLISGFVGGDAVGVILAVQPHKSDKICLIVDIGTNGEVILGNRNGLWATSCATGPALEGAHISCGVRALTGAVSMVDIEPNTGVIDYQVIGKENTVPFGICGSGIIDAIAAMRRANWVLPSGRFNEDISNIITDEQGFGTKVVLVPNKATVGKEIAITLKDIRQVQLAKAALSIGIEFLMRKAGITRIDRTILTGAFGAKFNWKSAADIGMLPPKAVANEVSLTENLAGIGAILALLDKNRRTEAVELSRHIRILELAGEPDFAERFAFATSFPSL